MASFADLPNEIVAQIISDVLPADLENFAQTCRKASSVAQPCLKVHRMLIRQFTTVDNTIKSDGHPFEELIHEILTHPLLSHYIFNLNYRWSYRRLDYQPREQQSFETLLPLLPHLKTLVMEDVISCDDLPFLNASFADPPFPTNLVNMYVRFPKELVQSFSSTRALCALPSLRLPSTHNCGYDHRCLYLFAPVRSHLTRLELWDCYIPPKEIHEFLRDFHQLQTFKHSTPFRNSTSSGSSEAKDYKPSWIPSGLLHSRSTLQHLTMLAPGQPASFMGSLSEFESLEEVYISWGLLGPDWGRRDASDLSLMLPKPLRLLRIQSEGGLCASNDWPLAGCRLCGQCAWNYSQLVEQSACGTVSLWKV